MARRFLIPVTLLCSCIASAQMPPASTGANASPAPASLIRSTNITHANATSLTASMPSGATAGDFCVVVFQAHNNGLSTPSGWTQVQYTPQSFWNGAFYYKTLASGDITGGITLTTTGGAEAMIITIVDFNGATGGYRTSASTEGTSGLTSSASPVLSGVLATDVVIYVAGYRGNVTATVNRGFLLQSYTDGSGAAVGIYAETLPSGFGTGVTYSYPGTYNPLGWWAGWIAVVN